MKKKRVIKCTVILSALCMAVSSCAAVPKTEIADEKIPNEENPDARNPDARNPDARNLDVPAKAAGTSGVSGVSEHSVSRSVELRYYEDSGWPYLCDVYTNDTEKTITSRQYCMLAYDKEGQPLELKWHIMDSSDKPSYECLYNDEDEIIPEGTDSGNWSLYDGEKMQGWPKTGDGGPNRAAYALYCDRKITFSDGIVWENPEYESWLKQYRGNSVPVDELKSYYPSVLVIDSQGLRTSSKIVNPGTEVMK